MTTPVSVLDELRRDVASRMGWPDGGAAGLRAWLDLPNTHIPAAPYDLTLPEHDRAQRQPHRSLVIATGYRSGSTLLAEGLAGAGGFGVPVEYLQAGAMQRRFPRFAAPTTSEYLSTVMRHRTCATGVFGIKLFWPEARFLDQLPDPTIIRLRREDVLAQAVSTWSALVTGVWRSPSPRTAEVPYDRARLTALTAMHAEHDANWQQALAGRPVINLTYEQLSVDPREAIESLVSELARAGLPAEGAVPPPRLARQGGERARALIDRLAEDIRSGRWM